MSLWVLIEICKHAALLVVQFEIQLLTDGIGGARCCLVNLVIPLKYSNTPFEHGLELISTLKLVMFVQHAVRNR